VAFDGRQGSRGMVAWLLAENNERVEGGLHGAGILDQVFWGPIRPAPIAVHTNQTALSILEASLPDSPSTTQRTSRTSGRQSIGTGGRRTMSSLQDLLKGVQHAANMRCRAFCMTPD